MFNTPVCLAALAVVLWLEVAAARAFGVESYWLLFAPAIIASLCFIGMLVHDFADNEAVREEMTLLTKCQGFCETVAMGCFLSAISHGIMLWCTSRGPLATVIEDVALAYLVGLFGFIVLTILLWLFQPERQPHRS